ncbi:GPW/gp25 family protein [Polyangium jinanense]|uniref:GPW/gp25 family protein n=1 Tax=Polyangium jinanense TaxID=2829994 RepID=A0A9X4AP73_9BACT|nr:GPW/gp25 family protein [Polyangium jinanense]MDC3979011.1 GPW/gp25 family protein [Polyangium jinanense]
MSFYGKLRGDHEPRLESIARNLEVSLNAKGGYASAVEVYGLGRYDGHFATKPLLDELCAEMLGVVRSYEPRLLEPKLTLIGRDRGLWVRFTLTGLVGEQPVTYHVFFHSVLRNVSVRRG